MLYCQYLSGMGHLIRSAEIARALARRSEVHFVNGGPPIAGFRLPDGVHRVSLPPVWLEDGRLRADGGREIERVKQTRRRRLFAAFDRVQPDCVITEFFPFGRALLSFELSPWMAHIRRRRPSSLIASSVRETIGTDNLVEQAPGIASRLNRYFDMVLYHSDPRLQAFETSFPLPERVRCPVHHTGLVAAAAQSSRNGSLDLAEPFVLATVGGGRLGYELLECMIAVARCLEKEQPHTFYLFSGPFMPSERYERLRAQAGDLERVHVERFTPDIGQYMARAALSVSLAGYNTTMSLLRARAPALVVPMGHNAIDHEQLQRATRLHELGLATMVVPEELAPERMIALVCGHLKRPRERAIDLDLDGAERTAAIVLAAIEARAAGARAIGAGAMGIGRPSPDALAGLRPPSADRGRKGEVACSGS